MRLLLDTHALLWALHQPQRLAPNARAAVAAPDSDVLVSAATAWEIAIKRALGRLDFPVERLDAVLREVGFGALSITVPHAVAAGNLPRHHDDPFDRLLIAQAQIEGLTLITVDRQFARYDVRIFGSSPAQPA